MVARAWSEKAETEKVEGEQGPVRHQLEQVAPVIGTGRESRRAGRPAGLRRPGKAWIWRPRNSSSAPLEPPGSTRSESPARWSQDHRLPLRIPATISRAWSRPAVWQSSLRTPSARRADPGTRGRTCAERPALPRRDASARSMTQASSSMTDSRVGARPPASEFGKDLQAAGAAGDHHRVRPGLFVGPAAASALLRPPEIIGNRSFPPKVRGHRVVG